MVVASLLRSYFSDCVKDNAAKTAFSALMDARSLARAPLVSTQGPLFLWGVMFSLIALAVVFRGSHRKVQLVLKP